MSAAHPDRPRPPRAPRLARGRRRPAQADRQVRPQPQAPARSQRGPVRHLARPPGPSAADPAADGHVDERRAARLARRRGRRDGAADLAARAPGSRRGSRPSPPATPTGPTPSPPATRVRRLGFVHAALNGTAAMLFGASLAARAAGARGRGKLLALAGMGAIGAGGYLGGHLTYAEGVGVNTTTFEDYPQDWTQALADAALGEGEMKAVDVDGAGDRDRPQRRPGLRARRHLRAPRRPAGRRRASATCVVPAARQPVPARGRLGRAGPGRLPAAGARDARARRLDRGARPAVAQTTTLPRHGRDQDGRRARRRPDGPRDRAGRAQAGYDVVLREVDDDRLGKGVGQDREAARPRRREGQARAGRRRRRPRRGSSGTSDYGDLPDCDLVIEAITEDLGLKLEMWREVDGIVKPEAYFATNTSSLAVIDQAAATSRPSASSACTSSTPRR